MPSKYLITGGLGFIGRHLARELASQGHEVRILDALVEQVHGRDRPETADLPKALDPPKTVDGAEVLIGDLRDASLVRRALDGVDGVFHLAAEVGVGQSMYEIERYVGANDYGTAVLLQELLDHPVERIVVASSMSIYGEGAYETPDGQRVGGVRRSPAAVAAGAWEPVSADGQALTPVPTDETKTPDLASIYALTKYAQERAVLIFGEAYKMGAVALRLFNVFGPGQALSNPYTGVLANFASRLAHDQPPSVFEDGRQRRDFVHVRDVARAFRLAMEEPQADGQAINVGSGRSYSIEEVARMLAKAMGKNIAPQILEKARSGDIRNCFADTSKAAAILGFQPQFLLEDSLSELAGWVAGQEVTDRGAEMRRELELRGLVS